MEFKDLLEKFKLRNQLRKLNKRKYNVFVCYHKPSKILRNKVLTPIHVGRSVAQEPLQGESVSENDLKWLKANMIGDDFADNISAKNRYYNECTATYWIWKNIKSPYVGLFHYRRILDLNASNDKFVDETNIIKKYGLNEKNLQKLLSEYDIILPKKMGFDISIYDAYTKFFVKDDIDFAFDYIKSKYPEMYRYAENLKTSHIAYLFNMVVTSKEIFNGYAEFLFDVLAQVENNITDRDKRSIYLQRTEGFLAERLGAIYFDYLVNEKNLKVKEFSVVRLDRIPEEYSPIQFKHTHVKALTRENKGISLVLRGKL